MENLFDNVNDAITYAFRMAKGLDQMVYVFTDGEIFKCFNYENGDSFAFIMNKFVNNGDWWRTHCITADGLVFEV